MWSTVKIRPFFAVYIVLMSVFVNSFVSAQSSAPTVTPEVSVTTNGTPEPQVIQGEPLIFTAVLSHPSIFENSVTPLQINPQSGSWANTVHITMTNNTGATITWPMQLVTTPTGVVTLDGQQTGILQWVVSSADSKNIAAGVYQVLAVLDTTASAGTTGWSGTTNSDGVLVQVNAPTSPTEAQIEQQLLSEAVANHLLGNDTQAIAALDQLLVHNPSSVAALELKGTLLTGMGQTKAALQATELALNALYAQDTSPQEPPSALLHAATTLREMVYGNSVPQSLPTTTTASSASVAYSPASQMINLIATVSSTSSSVTGGTVIFSVSGVGNPVTSAALTQGSASAVFTVPGGTHAGNYALQAEYVGSATYSPSGDTKAVFTVQKASPKIIWSNPTDITLGTTLGSGQLNATANVPGTFVFNPPANTVLPLGSGQVLSVNFTPSDTTDYNSAVATVKVNVKTLPGDLNGSGAVSCADLAIVKASFGKKTGQPGFDPRADVNGDGIVNILDLSAVARQLPAGTVCQ
jgi:Bacterial Ig-like domain (group 3)/Dockerin type I domain